VPATNKALAITVPKNNFAVRVRVVHYRQRNRAPDLMWRSCALDCHQYHPIYPTNYPMFLIFFLVVIRDLNEFFRMRIGTLLQWGINNGRIDIHKKYHETATGKYTQSVNACIIHRDDSYILALELLLYYTDCRCLFATKSAAINSSGNTKKASI
jgi:hypothetical protein